MELTQEEFEQAHADTERICESMKTLTERARCPNCGTVNDVRVGALPDEYFCDKACVDEYDEPLSQDEIDADKEFAYNSGRPMSEDD